MSKNISKIHDYEWKKACADGVIKQYFKTDDPIADINQLINKHAFFADHVNDWLKSSGFLPWPHLTPISTNFEFIELYIRQLFASHIYADLIDARRKIKGDSSEESLLRYESFTLTINFSQSVLLMWKGLFEDELPARAIIRLVADEDGNIVEEIVARGDWLH